MTAILVANKSRSVIEKELSDDLPAVSSWLVDNKLSLHIGKTKSIVVGSKHKLKSNPSLNVSCNGIVIQSTYSVKYLGATQEPKYQL